MHKPVCVLAIATLMSGVARADVNLIAIGTIPGTFEDLATQTAPPLENGVPGNRFGGIGSGFTHAGGSLFLGLPDRGPNATPYNPNIDDTTSYIPRFHTLNLTLAPADAGSPLPFVLTPNVFATTLLSSKKPLVYGNGAGLGVGSGVPALNAIDRTSYFTGRSDGFDASQPSTHPNNARFDPESIRVSRSGKSVFISDEYGPYVYEFDRDSGQRKSFFTLPAKFAVALQSPKGDVEIAGNASGRVAKMLFIDLVQTLNANGVASQDIPAKLEGLAFGPDLMVGGVPKHVLYVTSDNDFIATVVDTHHPAPGLANPNRMFVFAIDFTDLPSFVPQERKGEKD